MTAITATSLIHWPLQQTILPIFLFIFLLFILKKCILGDALNYQKNPAKFLLHKSHHDSIFDINLAGRKMVVMTGTCHDDTCTSSKSDGCPHRELLHQAMTLPERIFSAREAVADIGFLYTLGSNNVYRGTDFHKRCIKDYGNEHGDLNFGLLNALRDSYRVIIDGEQMKQQAGGNSAIVVFDDLLDLVRLATLRAIVVELLGESFLNCSFCSNEFLDEFMVLQDSIESATAAAAILPSWISVPLILKPVERRRKKLEMNIQERIRWAWQQDRGIIGPWLVKFRRQCDEGNLSLEVASEFVVGLLFAAAKNPAIASAQTLLFLILHGSDEHKSKVHDEAEQLLLSTKRNTSNNTMPMSAIRQSCYETLRLTSHSIGALRKVKEEVVLGSGTSQQFKLCPNHIVAVSHIVPSLDQRMWGKDTDKYNPSRVEWTKEDAKADEYKFSTFSQGHHRCPGQSIALQIMELTLSILLVQYEVTLQQKKEAVPDVYFERATIAQRKGKVPVKIRIRI